VGVREHVADHPLDPEVFRLQRPDQGHLGVRGPRDLPRERFSRQSADGDRGARSRRTV
jgi:hypothetical protein